MSDGSFQYFNKHTLHNVLFVEEVAADRFVPQSLDVLRRRRAWRLCQSYDLGVHLGDIMVCSESFQEVVDYFAVPVQRPLPVVLAWFWGETYSRV